MGYANTTDLTERIHTFMDRKLAVYPELRNVQPKKAAEQTVRDPHASFIHIGAFHFPIRIY